ncbi:MAG: HlyD family efflux transporter periplasmic adaptor subunit [Clostridia bacterium]
MKRKNTVIGLLLVVSIIVVAANFFREANSPYVKQTAKIGSYTNSISAQAFVIRDEYVINPDSTGVFEASVSEGDKVSAYMKLGTVVTGDVDQQKLNELEKLNKEIEALNSNISDAGVLAIDDNKVEATLRLSLDNLTYYSARDDIKMAVKLSSDIKILTERKSGTTSNDIAKDNLNRLIAQRDSVAASLGGAHQNIYAPCAGMFSKNLDGMEEVLTFDLVDSVSPPAVDLYLELMKKRTGSGVCKVVNNYKWYLVMNLSVNDAEGLSVGNSYSVAFEEHDSEIPGKIVRISEKDEEGRRAVVIQFTHHIESIGSMRCVDVKICKEKYTGIYIPASAVRVKDGVLGVYVQNEKAVRFRSITSVYKTDDFVLAKEGAEGVGGYDNIQLYDGLILNPNDGEN